MLDVRVDLGTVAYEADTLPTQLLCPVFGSMVTKGLQSHTHSIVLKFYCLLINKVMWSQSFSYPHWQASDRLSASMIFQIFHY